MKKKSITVWIFLVATMYLGVVNSAQAGTRFIPGDTEVGVWDINSRTYTLTTDVSETIQIDEDNLILDGAGHTVTGPGSGNGILLSGRTGVTVKDISVQEFSSGINLWYSSGNTLIRSTTTNNRTGINLHRSNDNTLTDNTASNNVEGLDIGVSSNNTLTQNIANNNHIGIAVGSSSNNNILTSNFANNNTGPGIRVNSSNNNALTGNNTSSNKWGIYLSHSNNTLTNNTASNNESGIELYRARNNILRNNLMSDNRYNFTVKGDDYLDFENDIDTSNLVDGDPVYYLVGASGTVIDSSSNAGTVYCIGCDNVTVKDLILTNEACGIYFYNTINSSIQNNQLNNNGTGIYLNSSSDNTITGNTASSNNIGIYLSSSGSNTITGNITNDNDVVGIQLYSGGSNTVIDNTASNNRSYGICLSVSNSNTLMNNTTNNNVYYNYHGWGIYLDHSSNNTITNNITSNNRYGMYIYRHSNNNNIADNTVSGNVVGIRIGSYAYSYRSCSGNLITGNDASNNDYVVFLYWSGGNNIIRDNHSGRIHLNHADNNTVINNNTSGISLETSNNNIITGNIISNSAFGIYLRYSGGNVLRDNLMSGNDDNFIVTGYKDSHFDNDINTSNLVDGKPIYYLIGASGTVVDSSSNAGLVYCFNCDDITVKGLTITNAEKGIYFYNTINSRIQNNSLNDNYYGIYLISSSNNTITENTASENQRGIYLDGSNNNAITDNNTSNNRYYYRGFGIYLGYSSDNTITDNIANNNYNRNISLDYSHNNTITGNMVNESYDGIYLGNSNYNMIANNTAGNNSNGGISLRGSNNTITGNTTKNNYYGIRLSYTNNNKIYLNNFIDNSKQAYGGSGDVFNLDKPVGGNYWSDWTGPDNDGDGFVDSPYVFTGGQDNLPWANQDGWLGVAPTTLSEKYSAESTLIETVLSQDVNLSDVIVSGDFNSVLDFTSFEIVTIDSGSFAGKGFSKGQFETTLDGVPYKGSWQGVTFLRPEERKIYLKGAIFGEILATVEGYITESMPESGIYDQYQAIWKIGRLGGTITSATINLNGNLSYLSSAEFPATELYLLQTNIEGEVSGRYSGSLDIVLTHLRIINQDNPYYGEGFSVVSYMSESGSGQGWTYDRIASPDIIELKGLFAGPLFGILAGTLDETELPRTLSLRLDRVDLGLPPMADLEVRTWGPSRVSPGQTVNYIFEYRNDGLRKAENVVVAAQLPFETEYVSSTNGGIYKWETHEVIWKLGEVSPKNKDNITATVRVQWALPWGTRLAIDAIIDTCSDEVDKYYSPETTPTLDAFSYQAYEKVEIVSSQYVDYNDLADYFADPNFENTFTYAHELGFSYSGVTTKTNFMDGSLLVTSLMDSGSGDELVLDSHYYYSDGAVAHVLVKLDEEEVAFFDRGGGLAYPNDMEPYAWGTWGEHSSCSYADCLSNCFEKKIPSYTTELIPWKKIKRLLSITSTLSDCGGCVSSGFTDQTKCDACASSLAGLGGPLGKLAVDVLTCHMECAQSPRPEEYLCEEDTVRAYCGRGFLQRRFLAPEVVIYDRCIWCRWNWEGYHICAADEICVAGECKPKDQVNNTSTHGTVIATARDPSIKYGPEGRVLPGQRLDYTVEYENEGEGIAFGVYFTDTLDEDLDDSTLEIGPVIDVNDSSVISGPGIYNPATRTITWFAGEVAPGEGGITGFSVNVRSDAEDGTEIINYATIYFPSVPEETRTNGIVSIVSLNQPPAADAGPDQTVEQENYEGTEVTLDGSASTDPDSTEGTNDDIVYFDWFEGVTLLGSGEIINYTFPLGSHTVTLLVTDTVGETDEDEVTIVVQDTTPPDFEFSVTPDVLWPPNHKMVLITPSWTASDICDESPEVSLVSIVMNEGDDAIGDGHTSDDIQVGDDGSIYLRAERSGTGIGRIYTITYQAVDDSGNTTVRSATVTVPHDKGKPK